MALSVGSKRRRGRGGFTDINVTPLVDVMLVLLIVFMVTAPLLSTSLRIDLPEVQATNQPLKDSKLVLSIDKDEKIFFGQMEDGTPVEITRDVERTLLENPRIQSEHEIYIRADKNARYRVVARAVAAARAAGVISLNLLVDPDLDKDDHDKDDRTGDKK